MPLVRIDMPKGKTEEQRKAVSAGVHKALMEVFSVPEDDLFQIISERGPSEFVHAKGYLGNAYSEDATVIEIVVSDTRGVDQKKRLYRRMVDLLVAEAGMRPDDVIIVLVETKRENWSFGRGEAPYA